MKIVSLQAVYPNYKNVPASWRTNLWQIVVRVESANGVVGCGYGGGGRAAVEVVNGHMRDLLVGREVERVEDIFSAWDALYYESIPYGRKGVGVMALSGIDLALWDLLAKSQDAPVYEVIGARTKSKIFSYATGTDAEWYAELGFKAHKFPHRYTGKRDYYDDAERVAENARRAMGPDARVMIDTYMTWDSETTMEMSRRLAPYDIYWFEDVLTPDDLDGQAALRPKVKPTLIAGGEHEFTHIGFADVARAGAMDLWQPDITWCGGITAGLRILDIAREHGVPVAPHRGGEVWGLHLIASSDCMDLAEVLPGQREARKDELWIGEPFPEDGFIAPTDAPGFGVTLNEAML